MSSGLASSGGASGSKSVISGLHPINDNPARPDIRVVLPVRGERRTKYLAGSNGGRAELGVQDRAGVPPQFGECTPVRPARGRGIGDEITGGFLPLPVELRVGNPDDAVLIPVR